MKTGGICMVGCTKLSSMIQQLTDDSMDCEIVVDLQFYPLNSEKEGRINGSFESRRENLTLFTLNIRICLQLIIFLRQYNQFGGWIWRSLWF